MGGFPDFLTLNSVSFSVLSISHLPTTIHHPPFLSFKSFLSWCVWASEGILVIATIHWVLTMDTRFTYIVSFYPSSSAGRELLPDYRAVNIVKEVKYPIGVLTVADQTPKAVHIWLHCHACQRGLALRGTFVVWQFFPVARCRICCSLSQEWNLWEFQTNNAADPSKMKIPPRGWQAKCRSLSWCVGWT